MPVDVDVLNVDGGGEGFERIVVKTVERRQQAQVLRNTLGQRLMKAVVLDRQRDIVCQYLQAVERVFFVDRIGWSSAQGNHANKFAANLQRADALEQFRCDVSVGAEKYVVGGAVQQYRPGGGSQRVDVPRQQWNQRWFRQQGKALRINRGEQGGAFTERKKDSLSGS